MADELPCYSVPFSGCYWVLPGRFLAGKYPGSADEAIQERRLTSLARSGIDVRPGFRQDPATFTSRIFVSETSAPALEAQLREGPMLVVAMLDSDGRLINRKLEPR